MKRTAKAIKISKLGLKTLLENFRKNFSSVAFGNVVYFVDESKSVTRQGKKALQKLTRVNITIGANYEGRINRDLVKQGEEANFTAQAMSGKVYVNNEGVLATDTKTGTKNYLVATVENHTKPDTIYFHEGKKIAFEKAKELGLFMPSAFTPKTTSGRGNMSEEKDFHTISPNLDNIISLTLNKVKYIVED
jgi:hypothetical protein